MAKKTLIACAVVLVLVGIGIRFGLASDDANPDASIERTATSPQDVATGSVAAPVQTADAPSRRAGPEQAPASEPAVAVAPPDKTEAPELLTGRVLDQNGDAAPFFRLHVDPPAFDGARAIAAVETRSDGTFTIPVLRSDPVRSKLSPADAGFTVLYSRSVTDSSFDAGHAPIVVIAPKRVIRGQVVTPAGDPVEGAKVTVSQHEGSRTRFDDLLFDESQVEWTGWSDAQGGFEIADAPVIEKCDLVAQGPAHRGHERVLDTPGPLAGVVITLEPVDPGRVVRGIVRDGKGDPIHRALVGLGRVAKTTGRSGEFEFQLDGNPALLQGPQRIVASAAGWCSATYEPDVAEGTSNDAIEWPAWIELRLTKPALGIEGIVVDASGVALPEATVWIEDLTVIGARAEDADEPKVAEHLGSKGPALWRRHRTDANGRFTIRQLEDRVYRLAALHPHLMYVRSGVEVRAGTGDARIELDPDVEVAEVRGHLVDQTGAPVEGATLRLGRTTLVVPILGTSSARVEHARSDAQTTDAEGAFDLGPVPLQEETRLNVHASGYSSLTLDVVDLPRPLDALALTLFKSCEVRIVDPSPPDERATGFAVVDDDGQRLNLTFFRGTSQTMSTQFAILTDGASGTFRVSGGARLLQWYKRAEVVATQVLELDPTKLNELRR